MDQLETLVSNQGDGKISIDALSTLKRFLQLAYWMVETLEIEHMEDLCRQLKEYAEELEP